MYSVLIIDDEEPLREAIKILGAWNELKIEELYEASSGRQALELLQQKKIHIALVDMKMPEISGIELLKILEEKYPDVLSIVISGYDDFEYTRQAIQSKVVDYILKPVNRHDLNDALRKCVERIATAKRKNQETIHQNMTLNMSLPKLKEKLYLSLIDASFTSYYNEDLFQLAGVERNNQIAAVCVLRLLNMDDIMVKRFKNDIDLMHFAISNVITDVSSNYFQSFSFANPKKEREIITILSQEGGYQDEMEFNLFHTMQSIVHSLKHILQLELIVGIGLPVEELTQLSSSYKQARRTIRNYEFSKNSHPIMKYDELKHNAKTSDHKSILNRMAQLRQVIDTGSVQLLQGFLQDTLKMWYGSQHFTIGEADKLVDELIMVLNDIAIDNGVQAQKLPISSNNPLRFLDEKGDFCNFEQYEGMLNRIIMKFKQFIDEENQQDTSFKVQDIKKYIDKYYHEDIKVTMFAEKYYLSREYLMKLFKQQYGCGIHEYVQSVRMEKAKELLQDASLKIQNISEMLGFKDKNYFSKAFRNYFEMTPSEYRAMNEK